MSPDEVLSEFDLSNKESPYKYYTFKGYWNDHVIWQVEGVKFRYKKYFFVKSYCGKRKYYRYFSMTSESHWVDVCSKCKEATRYASPKYSHLDFAEIVTYQYYEHELKCCPYRRKLKYNLYAIKYLQWKRRLYQPIKRAIEWLDAQSRAVVAGMSILALIVSVLALLSK